MLQQPGPAVSTRARAALGDISNRGLAGGANGAKGGKVRRARRLRAGGARAQTCSARTAGGPEAERLR